jgi:RNA polymerase sigma factor (sigma-70 family)
LPIHQNLLNISVKGTDAKRLAEAIRGHWVVENKLHWQLDANLRLLDGASRNDWVSFLMWTTTRPPPPFSGSLIRDLLATAVHRLQVLCASLLFRSYPRLTRPPLNLQTNEMLGAVVERLLKAMRQVRPGNVRQFFALANQHMRWELNDLARRLDEQVAAVELRDSRVLAPAEVTGGSQVGPNTQRLLQAIECLPEEEREVFNLVRLQGMTHTEAADVIGVSPKTVQRRLNRGLMLLTEQLSDLRRTATAD